MTNLRSLLTKAIELVSADWGGTSATSTGNVWLKEAREYLAQLPAEPTVMQPIETAPKDGTPILGYSISPFFGDRKTRFVVVHWAGEHHEWVMPGIGGLRLSHWTPLPSQPVNRPGES